MGEFLWLADLLLGFEELLSVEFSYYGVAYRMDFY